MDEEKDGLFFYQLRTEFEEPYFVIAHKKKQYHCLSVNMIINYYKKSILG